MLERSLPAVQALRMLLVVLGMYGRMLKLPQHPDCVLGISFARACVHGESQ